MAETTDRPPNASAPVARYRIAAKTLSVEATEAEVARLRGLPDAEIGALHRAGRIDEWQIALGAQPDRVPELPTLSKAAGDEARAASASTPAPAPRAAPASEAKAAPVSPRKPRLSAEQKADIERRQKAALDANDVASLEALVKSKEYVDLILDTAFENVTGLAVKSPFAALLSATVGNLVVKTKLAIAAARGRKLETRVAALEERMGTMVSSTVEALQRRVAELEQRLASVNTNGVMSYKGIWRADATPYREQEVCTHEGTLWFCHRATHEKPGKTDDWQLMAKNLGRAR